ncbi:MAG: hypothetical protein RLZZ50_1767 [Verrucomicrobiota bacterium]|jgi:EF hand
MTSAAPVVRLVLLSCLSACAGVLRAEEPGKAKSDVPASVLQRYDRNKDGKLGDEEKAKWEADKAARREKEKARRSEMLEKYDANKDGKLSEEEKAAVKLEWQRERTEKDAEKMKERAAKEKADRQVAAQASEKTGGAGADGSDARTKDKTSSDKMSGDSPAMMME